MQGHPRWMRKAFSPDGTARAVRALQTDLGLATVCESARCPNLRECYSQRQLTFMILGDQCTRRCAFCAVDHGKPRPVARDEPWRVAEAVRRLGLRHAVITSVARDDLPDQGAGQFVDVMTAVRQYNPSTTLEVLVPDFRGRADVIRRLLLEGRPEVFAHNLETVERLSPLVRPQASYRRSLEVLRLASSIGGSARIKSSLMVGFGESADELSRTLSDLRTVGVTHLTIGQYLRPDAEHLPVMDYVSPARFAAYARHADAMGFVWVKAGPFVRSSYHAVEALTEEPSAMAEVVG